MKKVINTTYANDQINYNESDISSRLKDVVKLIKSNTYSLKVWGNVWNLVDSQKESFLYGIICMDTYNMINIDTDLPGIQELYMLITEYGADVVSKVYYKEYR